MMSMSAALPRLTPLPSGLKHANFFEIRATEYPERRDQERVAERLVGFRPTPKARANDAGRILPAMPMRMG